MTDQDFNFNPPPRREAKKPFEPPPWELDQFEDLARRKAAEQAMAAEALAVEAAVWKRPEVESGRPLGAPTAANAIPAASSVQGGTAGGWVEPEDPRVEAMLLGLRNEDPPFGAELWKVPVVASAVLATVGVVLVVWGVFALSAARKAGINGSLGGGILIAFGLGFIGAGAWMTFRILRQQGVL